MPEETAVLLTPEATETFLRCAFMNYTWGVKKI
jgi:hypothetical protein